jgi:hypothetical protein
VTEYLLWGLRPGDKDRWREELLTCSPTREARDRIRRLAEEDGFHSFRESEYTLGERPDFGGTVAV